jgi:hypothetical protein
LIKPVCYKYHAKLKKAPKKKGIINRETTIKTVIINEKAIEKSKNKKRTGSRAVALPIMAVHRTSIHWHLSLHGASFLALSVLLVDSSLPELAGMRGETRKGRNEKINAPAYWDR